MTQHIPLFRSMLTLSAAALMLAAPLHAAEAPKQKAPVNASAAVRAPSTDSRSELFDRLDANRDGFLSQLELDADSAARGNWIAMDQNNDGRISRDEFVSLGRDEQRAAVQGSR